MPIEDDLHDVELTSTRDQQQRRVPEKARLLQQQQDSGASSTALQQQHDEQQHYESSGAAFAVQHQGSSFFSGGDHAQHGLRPAAAAAHRFAARHQRMLTTFLIAISRVLEATDSSLLPAVYLYVGCAFAATPAQLGAMTFTRLLTQAFASPLGGLLGHKLNRARLVAATCWYWAFWTTLFAYSTATWQGLVLWAFNGVGLGVMIPNAQSLIADYYDATHRGRAFGMLLAVGNLGAMLASVYATNIGALTIFGLQGWRFAFLSVAAVSALAGLVMWMFARDPRCSARSWKLESHWSSYNHQSNSYNARSVSVASEGLVGRVRAYLRSPVALEVWMVITTPSFIVVVIQGFLGSMPWGAFAFSTLYLQLQGWSDFSASTVMALFSGADAAGAFLGGVVGDWAAARFPDHGRIAACQFSVGIGVPMCLLIFQGLPLGSGPAIYLLYAGFLGLMGLLISWAATACNNPIFAEIVPAHLRTLVYAFDRCFEGALSAAGAPLVGLAAQRLFGFQGAAASAADCDNIAAHTPVHHQPDLVKARALGNSLTLFSTIPWTLCALVYTLLHWTYPRDKRRSNCTGDSLTPVEEFSALPAADKASPPDWLPDHAERAEHAAPFGIRSVLQKIDDVIEQADEYISNPHSGRFAAAVAGATVVAGAAGAGTVAPGVLEAGLVAVAGAAAAHGVGTLSEVELHDWENDEPGVQADGR